MYDELAPWWPLLSAPDDYAEEAAFYERVLVDHGGSLINISSAAGIKGMLRQGITVVEVFSGSHCVIF